MATDKPLESENSSADTLSFELVVSFTLGEMHTAESDTALTGKGVLTEAAMSPVMQKG